MKNSSSLIAFISALSLHLIIGSVLLMSVDFSLPKEKPKGVIINASVVSQKLFDDLAQRKTDKKLAEKRKIEKAREEKKARDDQRKKIAKEKALRKKREAERIKTEKSLVAKKLKVKKEAEKAKKLAESKLRKKELARIETEKKAIAKQKKMKAERLKAEKVAKIKAEKIAKQKAAEKERLRQADLDKQMEAEFADEFSDAKSSKQLSEIARYKALIQNKISRNWTISSEMKGKSCTLAIRLAPDGLVLSVDRSRGDKKLCASAKRATLKAQTLPIPKDSEISQQFRDFDITLKPDL